MAQLQAGEALDGLEPTDDRLDVAGDVETAGLPSADGQQNMGVALGLQIRHGGGFGIEADVHAQLVEHGGVLVHGLIRDPEGGDHLPDDAAQLGFLLEEGDCHALPGQQMGRGHTGGTAADDGDLDPGLGSGGRQGGQHGVIAPFGGHQLGGANLHGPLVEIPGTLVHAVVGADGAGDKGQGVLLQNHPQGGLVLALTAELDILGDILSDGAAALAGGRVAVEERDLLIELPPGQRLDGLPVQGIAAGLQCQGREGHGVHLGEGLEGQLLQLLADLLEPLVAAGLQFGGGHGDGPDAAGEDLVDVEVVGAAGVAQPQLAAELLGDAVGHFDGQREEGLAGHIHLLGGQLVLLHVHREGVGELQAELQAVLLGQGQQAAEHGNGIRVLEVVVKVELAELDIVIAHGVQNGPGGLIAQNGGIALDEGVQVLLPDQVGGDGLDLRGRAAVEGGDRDGVGDAAGQAVDEVGLAGIEPPEDGLALLVDGGVGGVHHFGDELVDLLTLDTGQIVAHGHIEDKAVGVAQAVDLGEDFQGEPGLDVLLIGLGDIELRGPLAVIALVLSQNAGPVDAGGQISAVHLLDGFQLKEPGPGEVGGDDILGQLGIGTGGGAEGGLDVLLAEDRQLLLPCPVGPVDAEGRALPLELGGQPIHQLGKGNGDHPFTHLVLPP